MKKSFIALVTAAAVLAACTKEAEIVEQAPLAGGKVSTVTVKSDAPTKAIFENDKTMKWQEGDVIGVYVYSTTLDNTSQYNPWIAPYTLSSGAGEAQAKFSHVFEDEALGETFGNVAIYPYAQGSSFAYDDVTGGELTLELPSEWDAEDLTTVRMPMIAALDMSDGGDKGTFSFKHLGGAVKITIGNLNENARYIKLSAGGKKLSGTFSGIRVADAGTVKIETVNTDSYSDGMVQLNVPAGTTFAPEQSFYFPVPTGTYNALQIDVYAEDGHLLFSKTAASANTIERGDILIFPTVTAPEVVHGWNIIGVNGDWDNDVLMTDKTIGGTTYRFARITSDGGGTLKFRKNGAWTENFGATGSDDPTAIAIDIETPLAGYGYNFVFQDPGEYDVYLDVAGQKAWFLYGGDVFIPSMTAHNEWRFGVSSNWWYVYKNELPEYVASVAFIQYRSSQDVEADPSIIKNDLKAMSFTRYAIADFTGDYKYCQSFKASYPDTYNLVVVGFDAEGNPTGDYKARSYKYSTGGGFALEDYLGTWTVSDYYVTAYDAAIETYGSNYYLRLDGGWLPLQFDADNGYMRILYPGSNLGTNDDDATVYFWCNDSANNPVSHKKNDEIGWIKLNTDKVNGTIEWDDDTIITYVTGYNYYYKGYTKIVKKTS